MITIVPNSIFPLGQVVATESALRTLTTQELRQGLERHARADWGDVSEESIECNDDALGSGYCVMSAYGHGDKRFWIITEPDRSATKIMLPEDYFGRQS